MIRSLVTLVTLALTASALPTRHHPKLIARQVDTEVVANEYIVKLKDGTLREAHVASLPFAFSASDDASPILNTYDESIFNGYAGKFTQDELHALLENDEVEYVEPNVIMYALDSQTNAPWGLQSISTRTPVGGNEPKTLKYTYNYDAAPGSGVDIYIIDTGIQVEHEDFEGRASWLWAAPPLVQKDGNGHGTHCASTAAGKQYGVAKAANLFAVKVLADQGGGSTSDIIAGIEQVKRNREQRGNAPSIASMSLGGAASPSLDSAVKNAIRSGIQFTIAAGNSNQDAVTSSPARVVEAITVGASTIENKKASFSNYGPIVDIWAPGQSVTAAWIGVTNRETNNISGTSMATPHVAGLAAYILSKDRSLSPEALQERIKALGTRNALTGVPPGTVNLLAFNGVTQNNPSPTPSSSPSYPTPTSSTSSTSPSAPMLPRIPIIPSSLPLPPILRPGSKVERGCPSWWSDCYWKRW